MKISLGWRLSFVGISLLLLAGCRLKKPPQPNDYSNARALINQGVLQLREGMLAEAAASFTVAGDIVPIPEALDGLGSVAFMSGDLELAEQYYNQITKYYPEYEQVHRNLALLYEAQDRVSDAGRSYARAVVLLPYDPRLRNNYSVFIERQQADRTRAVAELLKAQAIESSFVIEENLKMLRGSGREK